MTTRTKLEATAGAIVLVLLLWFGYDKMQQMADVRVAMIIAQHDREADAKLDSKLKDLKESDEARQRDYDLRSAQLPKLTPQQIVVKLPEYVPAATSPIRVITPEEAQKLRGVVNSPLEGGDAIVPQQDIKPIAQALLDGQKCSADFASCKESVGTWQAKYETKSDEAARWQTAAKGGSVWKRMGKTALKVGIGIAVGYAVAKR
jgi:hypothetical protein